jgi:hypothetical protein
VILVSDSTGHGGARKGAGRKAKPDKFKLPIAKAESKIADKLPWLIDKELELADGVWKEQLIDGEVRIVYQEKPDHRAITYLIDRIMGKPTERKEHTFPDKPYEEMTEDELRQIRDS